MWDSNIPGVTFRPPLLLSPATRADRNVIDSQFFLHPRYAWCDNKGIRKVCFLLPFQVSHEFSSHPLAPSFVATVGIAAGDWPITATLRVMQSEPIECGRQHSSLQSGRPQRTTQTGLGLS
jgi:hypothetical protein